MRSRLCWPCQSGPFQLFAQLSHIFTQRIAGIHDENGVIAARAPIFLIDDEGGPNLIHIVKQQDSRNGSAME